MANLETSHEDATVRKDTTNTPSSDKDTHALQADAVADSAAVDADVDEADITVLPGTGGPDDVGDVEVDPKDLNMSGH